MIKIKPKSKLVVPPFKGPPNHHPDGVSLKSIAMSDAEVAKVVAGLTKSGAMRAMSTEPVKDGIHHFVARVPKHLVDWLDSERPRRGHRSRNETLIAVLAEAMAK